MSDDAFAGVPQLANMLEGGRTPLLDPKELKAMGFAMIAYPTSLIFRVARTIEKALADLTAGRLALAGEGVDFAAFKAITGFEDWVKWETIAAAAPGAEEHRGVSGKEREVRMRALKTVGLSLLAACLAGSALAQGAPEKPKVVLGVGGKPALYYLPLTIAERKGFFKEEGLEVEINDFAGGARALQALVGGSVDVVTGAYEHTVRMQAKGQDIRGVAELGRFPSITVAVRKEQASTVKSAADFKGKKIGVTAPGSSTYLIPLYAMSKAGLKASDASFIGVGATASAVAAIQRGEIDIISNTEPVISKLEQEGAVVPLIDTRTEAGTRALFGGPNPAATLYTRTEFIEKNPETTSAPRQRVPEVARNGFGRRRPKRSPTRFPQNTISATRRSTSRRCASRSRAIPATASYRRRA